MGGRRNVSCLTDLDPRGWRSSQAGIPDRRSRSTKHEHCLSSPVSALSDLAATHPAEGITSRRLVELPYHTVL